MNQQAATTWSFEQLATAFDSVFAELTDDIIDGTVPALSDEEMVALNLTWIEVLADARWTGRQWQSALVCETRLAAYPQGDGCRCVSRHPNRKRVFP